MKGTLNHKNKSVDMHIAVSTCVQHMTSMHLSVERDKERTNNITNLNVSALPGSTLTSWTSARAVLNSLSFLT